MNALKKLSWFLIFFPVIAFADDASSARAQLISANLDLIKTVLFLSGFTLFVTAGYKLTLITTEGSKRPYAIPLMGFLVGAILMNPTISIGILGQTYFKASEFCFVVSDGAVDDSCMNTEISGVTGELKARIEKHSSRGVAEAFMQNARFVIGIFQIIGFIYFAVGAWGLKQVAGNEAEHGYGKPIIIMFASALIVDLPHTAAMAIETLEQIGINF